jgi:hypothetical protein
MARKISAGKIIPPSAATIGTIADLKSFRPCLISRPTRKKKIAISTSMNMGSIYWKQTQQSPPF